ncbi:MAG: squalene/phytoene synthase family protein [Phycisphaerales bacterium]|nr:squalene/phytoene synthase family protein [Phycisphaerales bacterium]
MARHRPRAIPHRAAFWSSLCHRISLWIVYEKQIDRAAGFYQASRGLENHLDQDSRACCWAMGEIYHQLLLRIATQPLAVLHGRVSISKWHKLGIGLRAKLGKPWVHA